jgi:AAT family amino acid transporter
MANLIALGGIIGSCYFLGSGYLVEKLGVGAALAYAMGGIIIWVVMQSFGELCVNVPRQGSFVSYAAEFLSPSWAVATGWSYWFNWIAYVPSEAVAGGIIMNVFIPQVPVIIWAILFLILITIINIINVEGFGFIESILALIKIFAVIGFSLIAILLIFGIIGEKAIGLSIMLEKGKSLQDVFFPSGIWIIFTTMAMILVNFQGSEIVGLASSETQNPKQTVPRACKQVTYRIIAVYMIPIILLVMILPYKEAGLEDSVFALALKKYSHTPSLFWLKNVAGAFSFVILSAAFSCANSGMYATVRALYSLSVEGFAPKFFSKLNKAGVPRNATLFSLFLCWCVLAIWFFFEKSDFYTWLLSVSGFTGAFCWITICLSQIMFRTRIKKQGYNKKDLIAPAPLSPWLPLFVGVILQVFGLVVLAFNKDLQGALYICIPVLLIPFITFKIYKKISKSDFKQRYIAAHEKPFEILFPSKAIINK